MHYLNTVIATTLTLFLVPLSARSQESHPSDKEKFEAAVGYLEAGRYVDAIPLLREVRASNPEIPSVLWNLGTAEAAAGDHKSAVETWAGYERVDPGDWRAIPKLIQSFESLGNEVEVARHRARLYELRSREGGDGDLREEDRYCREQFSVGEQRVFAFEHFEPGGRRAVYYTFSFLTAAGDEAFRVSLGSYLDTNEVLWELGDLPRDKRLYHLDRYEPDGRQTLYTFFEALPPYRVVREAVREFVEGKTRGPTTPRSAAQPGNEADRPPLTGSQ
jgi:tetratricopeptide (TPR) repeat protein